jgi:putative hydrolase of the HAD superfamily
MPLAAVVFDFDDTLAVSTRDRRDIMQAVVEETGSPPVTREQYERAHRNHLTAQTREPIFEAILGDDDAVDPAEMAAAYRRRVTESMEPVDGAEQLLSELDDGYRLGLLTNGPVLAQESKVEYLGWFDRFDAVRATGSLPAGKPDPRAFEAVLEELDVDPGRAAYVGDSVRADVAGAAAAGLHPIQVLVPGGPPPDDRAVAHVPREQLADRLPAVLSRL